MDRASTSKELSIESAKPASSNDAWWANLKIAELITLASVCAFICGLAHDHAFLSSLDSQFLYILSVHDSINSGIAFILPILTTMVIGHAIGWFLSGSTRRIITLMLIYIATFRSLRYWKSLQKKIVIYSQARWVAERVAADLKSEYDEKVAKGEIVPEEKSSPNPIFPKLVFWFLIVTVLLYVIYISCSGPWNIFTVVFALAWVYLFLGILAVVGARPPWFTPNMANAILVMPLIVAMAVINGVSRRF